MRIIAGKYKGRKLEVPNGRDIRPTSDKIRGGIFNALLARLGSIDGLSVIDVCCGTGALGLEALSRGAQSCVFLDKSRTSLALARQNAHKLDQDICAEFIPCDAAQLRPRSMGSAPCDVFFCDPPYHMNLITPALQALQTGDWLADGAYGVLEAEKNWIPDIPLCFDIVAEKTYGDTRIVYVRKQ